VTLEPRDRVGPDGRQFYESAADEGCGDSEPSVSRSGRDSPCLERPTYGDVAADGGDDNQPRAGLGERVLHVRSVSHDQHTHQVAARPEHSPFHGYFYFRSARMTWFSACLARPVAISTDRLFILPVFTIRSVPRLRLWRLATPYSIRCRRPGKAVFNHAYKCDQTGNGNTIPAILEAQCLFSLDKLVCGVCFLVLLPWRKKGWK